MKRDQIFFYIFFGVIIVATALLVRPYIVAVILAFFSALLFYPIYAKFLKKTNGRMNISAFFTLIAVFLLMLIPLTLMAGLIIRQVLEFKDNVLAFVNGPDTNLDQLIISLNQILERIPGVQDEVTSEEVTDFIQQSLRSFSVWLLDSAVILGNTTLEFITKLIIYLSFLFVFLTKRDDFIKYVMKLSPMDNSIDRLYIKRVSEMSKSMILGTFAIAAIQAIVTGVVMFILGVPYVGFWTALMTFTGIIPFVGTQIISIPMGIVEIASGNIWEGVLLILFAIFVVGFLDNLLRPVLVTKDAELHPLLTLLGVLGGMKMFGVLGFILGPVLMIIFYTTVETYLNYYNLNGVSKIKANRGSKRN